jgi:hypothetical protein
MQQQETLVNIERDNGEKTGKVREKEEGASPLQTMIERKECARRNAYSYSEALNKDHSQVRAVIEPCQKQDWR